MCWSNLAKCLLRSGQQGLEWWVILGSTFSLDWHFEKDTDTSEIICKAGPGMETMGTWRTISEWKNDLIFIYTWSISGLLFNYFLIAAHKLLRTRSMKTMHTKKTLESGGAGNSRDRSSHPDNSCIGRICLILELWSLSKVRNFRGTGLDR